MSLIWNTLQQGEIEHSRNLGRSNEKSIKTNQEEIAELRLAVEALWQILERKLDVSENDLQEEIKRLRDYVIPCGSANIENDQIKCPNCGQVFAIQDDVWEGKDRDVASSESDFSYSTITHLVCGALIEIEP